MYEKYPATRYHATRPPVTVRDEAEERALGPGWFDSPARVEPVAAVEPARKKGKK